MSSELKVPARRTTILSPSWSHSRTEPGPTPSFRHTSAGPEIWPCAASLERSIGITSYYPCNGTVQPLLLMEERWVTTSGISEQSSVGELSGGFRCETN